MRKQARIKGRISLTLLASIYSLVNSNQTSLALRILKLFLEQSAKPCPAGQVRPCYQLASMLQIGKRCRHVDVELKLKTKMNC